MTTYAQAVIDLVGDKFIGGPTDGPVEMIRFTEGTTPPTEKEIQAKLSELQADYDSKQYQRDRAIAYPSIQDVVVALAEKEEGNDAMWQEITALRQKVKSENPKPT